jgi:SAM-dependent methyltransferase
MSIVRQDRDIADLRLFYHGRLGRWVTRRLNRLLRMIWPDVQGQTIVGLGYAAPYLSAWPHIKALAVMPASQGVVRWPHQGACQTVLSEDHIVPFADETIDRIIIAHELENTDHLGPLLQECWRVLKPEGRLLVIAPNRMGLWVRSDATPFGYGRAFSSRQLRLLLQNHRFVWEQRQHALFIPPSEKHVWLSMGGLLEWAGSRIAPHLGGLILAEASKQVYNLVPPTPRPNAPVTQLKPVLSGEGLPSPVG